MMLLIYTNILEYHILYVAGIQILPASNEPDCVPRLPLTLRATLTNFEIQAFIRLYCNTI